MRTPSYYLCHCCFEVFSHDHEGHCKKCNTKIINLFTIEDFKSNHEALVKAAKEAEVFIRAILTSESKDECFRILVNLTNALNAAGEKE